MIVWDGYNDTSAALDSGGIYDPATDTWQPLPTESAPSARYSHSAAWTGVEMVIWGGCSDTANLRDGGAYYPSTGLWRPLSDLGAPTGRGYHAALSAADRMIQLLGSVRLRCPLRPDHPFGLRRWRRRRR